MVQLMALMITKPLRQVLVRFKPLQMALPLMYRLVVVDINNAACATQADLVDNNFKMPQVWRNSLCS